MLDLTAPVSLTATEEFDGSTWATGGAVINCREGGGAAGTQNSTVFFGGRTTPANANRNYTEEYNGSAWSAGGAMIIARGYHFGGSGTQNAGLVAGGASIPNKRWCMYRRHIMVPLGHAGTCMHYLLLWHNGLMATWYPKFSYCSIRWI